jgi:hypothetical protein
MSLRVTPRPPPPNVAVARKVTMTGAVFSPCRSRSSSTTKPLATSRHACLTPRRPDDARDGRSSGFKGHPHGLQHGPTKLPGGAVLLLTMAIGPGAACGARAAIGHAAAPPSKADELAAPDEGCRCPSPSIAQGFGARSFAIPTAAFLLWFFGPSARRPSCSSFVCSAFAEWYRRRISFRSTKGLGI